MKVTNWDILSLEYFFFLIGLLIVVESWSNVVSSTLYQRIVTDGKPGEWIKLKTLSNVSVRELKVELEICKLRSMNLWLLQQTNLVKV